MISSLLFSALVTTDAMRYVYSRPIESTLIQGIARDTPDISTNMLTTPSIYNLHKQNKIQSKFPVPQHAPSAPASVTEVWLMRVVMGRTYCAAAIESKNIFDLCRKQKSDCSSNMIENVCRECIWKIMISLHELEHSFPRL